MCVVLPRCPANPSAGLVGLARGVCRAGQARAGGAVYCGAKACGR